MSLLRFVARSMLASYFVINGVKAIRHPEDLVESAQPVADTVLPLVSYAVPEAARGYLPEDTAGFVRWTGVLQVAGGLGLATGLGRRLGAGVLALTMVPHVLASNPLRAKGAERTVAQARLTKNVALLGGVLLAAQDTEGRPNLAWKVRAQKQLVAKEAAKRKAELQRDAQASAVDAGRRARRSARKVRKTVADVLS
ncbi:DoxX family membrane protein [Propionicimonas sp.]|uniref:DoxX family membrane protein n=1 Tax=Propionicimonas sp. TaxID=1955623 RepID=UPI0039E5B765